MIEWDADNPLARAKRETRRANAALRDYVLMGAGRSLRELHERYRARSAPGVSPATRRLATLKTWSSRYAWQDRVTRFEDLEADRALAAWRSRQEQIREQEWQESQKLLKWPISRQTVEDVIDEDGTTIHRTIVVEPTGWSQADIVRMLKLASDLGRRATRLDEGDENSLEIVIRSYGGIDLENDI